MALKTDIRGMVWKYPDTFVVGREQVRQYARAVNLLSPEVHSIRDQNAECYLDRAIVDPPLDPVYDPSRRQAQSNTADGKPDKR